MANIIGIYKITSPSGKVYIGQSVNVEKRFSVYKSLQTCRQVKLFASFLKYGTDNHVFEIIEECEIKELNIKERFWQDHYNCMGEKGLNLRLTTTDGKSGRITESHKQRIGASSKGRKYSEEVRLRMSEGQKRKNSAVDYVHPRKGKKHTEESKHRMSESRKGLTAGDKNPNYGKSIPEEQKEKLRKANTGKIASIETRLKMSEAQKRRWIV